MDAPRCGTPSPILMGRVDPPISCDLPAGHDGPHEHHHPRVVIAWEPTTPHQEEGTPSHA